MLKTVLWSGLYVVAGTMATAILACVVWAISSGFDAPSNVGQLAFSISMTFFIGALLGILLCFVALPTAALTMPPVIGLAHILKLPRPFVDIAGGALAALPCPLIMISLSDSMARSKGGGAMDDEFKLLLEACALLGGGMLGYVRYIWLVKPRLESAQLAPAASR